MDEMLGHRSIGNFDDDISQTDDSPNMFHNTLSSFVPIQAKLNL